MRSLQGMNEGIDDTVTIAKVGAMQEDARHWSEAHGPDAWKMVLEKTTDITPLVLSTGGVSRAERDQQFPNPQSGDGNKKRDG